jgi:hypothetical protein
VVRIWGGVEWSWGVSCGARQERRQIVRGSAMLSKEQREAAEECAPGCRCSSASLPGGSIRLPAVFAARRQQGRQRQRRRQRRSAGARR